MIRIFFFLRLFFKMRSKRKNFKSLFSLKIRYYTAFKPGEGARALRFALCPFPGAPTPSTPNAF